jgi:hypothetical protein
MSDSLQIEINHLSDIHTHTTSEKNTLIVERLNNIYKYIVLEQENPINIITGDVTDDGTRAQMDQFLHILGTTKLINHTLMTPGNHDYIKYGNQLGIVKVDILEAIERFQNKQKLLAEKLIIDLKLRGFAATLIHKQADQYTKDGFFGRKSIRQGVGLYKTIFTIFIKELKLIILLLDSNPFHLNEVDFARGTIGPKQMGLMRGIINTDIYSDWRKVVCLHHHPVYHSTFLKLTDSDEFLSAVWNTVDLVLFGHRHHYDLWSNNNAQKWNGYMSASSNLRNNDGLILNTFTITEKDIKCTTHRLP